MSASQRGLTAYLSKPRLSSKGEGFSFPSCDGLIAAEIFHPIRGALEDESTDEAKFTDANFDWSVGHPTVHKILV